MTTSPEAPKTDAAKDTVTAALLIIGNEILSGRTKDANLPYIAEALNSVGVRLSEVRVVPDIEAEIVAALNALRTRYDYVFTTGGIGPTHDDITAESVAAAFGRKLIQHPEARRRLEEHYRHSGTELTPARLRMANTPEGASLVDNPISTAPGFQVENVFVMAGVPKIMQAMMDGVKGKLKGGKPLSSRTVLCNLPEGVVAEGLGAIQDRYDDVDIGSYPHYARGEFRVSLVLRGADVATLERAAAEVAEMVTRLGGKPVMEEDLHFG